MTERAWATTAARLHAVEWFASVGRCDAVSASGLPFAVTDVSGWDAALAACAAPEWEVCTAERGGDLTASLHERCPRDYQSWNLVVTRVKRDLLEPVVEPAIRRVSAVNDLPPVFGDCVRWDVINGLMEMLFAACAPPRFFSALFELYEIGRFPCGWSGEWPEGRLLVY